jgi:hypothetical protein
VLFILYLDLYLDPKPYQTETAPVPDFRDMRNPLGSGRGINIMMPFQQYYGFP